MGLLNFKSKKTKKEDTFSNDFIPADIIELLNDGISVFGVKSELKKLKYFLEIPELNNVITYKARMFSKMKLDIVSDKTLQPVNLTNPIKKILETPNPYQSQKEFLTLTKLFREIYGEEYIYKFKPVGFGISRIDTLNPLNLEVRDDNIYPEFLRTENLMSYKYKYRDKYFNVEPDDLIIINNPSATQEYLETSISQYDKASRGSKIDSLTPNLDNIISAYESRGILLRHRGALGILSNDNAKDTTGAMLPIDNSDKEELQKQFKKYGLSKNQWHTIITNLSLKWQNMAQKPKDLMLFEEIESDFMRICDAYGMDYMLFSTEKGATFTNKKEAQRQTYENTTIPEAQEWISALNKGFGLENKSYSIIGTFEHLNVFSENKKEWASSIRLATGALSEAYTQDAISLEEYQRVLNEKFGLGNE